MSMSSVLSQFVTAYAAGSIRVIDLTHVLSPEFPTLVLPPQFGQVKPFRLERISRYDQSGPGWYWNNFSCGEHTGTHFDAPAHWITGSELPNNTVDTIDIQKFIAPAAVVDASSEVAGDEDWTLTVDFLEQWEIRHGRIPEGCWRFVLIGQSGLLIPLRLSTTKRMVLTRRAQPEKPWNG